MSTRNDVAKLAGVSPAVVSYVLNNSNYVSEEKRKAVLDAVEKLNYHPNLLASSLKSGKSKEFLLITDDLRNVMFSEIAYHLEQQAFETGYTITVMSSGDRTYSELIAAIQGHQFAGVFIFSGLIPLTKNYTEQLNQLVEQGIPIVLFMFIQNSSPLHEKLTVLHADIRSAVGQAVDYLIEEKHHRIIAYLGDGDPKASGESLPFGDGLRVNGYVDSLIRHGIEPRTDLVFFLDQFESKRHEYLNTESVIATYFAMPEDSRPTAFFVNSDELAASLMHQFKKHGVLCPDNIQIVSFGNTILSEYVTPGLTTVHLPTKEIADYTVQVISNRIAGRDIDDVVFSLPLIIKGSA